MGNKRLNEVTISTSANGKEVTMSGDDFDRAAQLVGDGVLGPVADDETVVDNDYRRVGYEVLTLCQELINRHHEPLRSARIGLIFRFGTWKHNGRVRWGSAEKVSGKWRAMAGDLDFLITLNEEVWARISKRQQRALLDHELCHCQFDPDTLQAKIRGHDIEEFNEIIARYGAWADDIIATEDAFEVHKQLRLDLDREERRGEVVAVEPEGA